MTAPILHVTRITGRLISAATPRLQTLHKRFLHAIDGLAEGRMQRVQAQINRVCLVRPVGSEPRVNASAIPLWVRNESLRAAGVRRGARRTSGPATAEDRARPSRATG